MMRILCAVLLALALCSAGCEVDVGTRGIGHSPGYLDDSIEYYSPTPEELTPLE